MKTNTFGKLILLMIVCGWLGGVLSLWLGMGGLFISVPLTGILGWYWDEIIDNLIK